MKIPVHAEDLPLPDRERLFRALRVCVSKWASECDFYKDTDEETQSEFQPCLYIYKAQGICEGIQICTGVDVLNDLNKFFDEFGSAIGMDETSEENQKQILFWAWKRLELYTSCSRLQNEYKIPFEEL